MSRKLVVLGGGQAGLQAVASLRQRGFDGPLKLICGETCLPYMRPPLSKAFLKGEIGALELPFRPDSFFTDERVDIHVGAMARLIDTQAKHVELDTGTRLEYDQLVLATGARARSLRLGESHHTNSYCLRTLHDAISLRDAMKVAKKVSVIGAGFIGLEFASVAAGLGKQVTVVEAAGRIMARALSTWMSSWFLNLHQQNGVEIHTDTTIDHVECKSDVIRSLRLSNGTSVETDLVVFGVGAIPNTELAENAGLAVQDGVLVDSYLATSDPSIFAIGDCARFPTPYAPYLCRLESVQNAVDQAKRLAEILTGGSSPYNAVPWFWTEQFGMKLQMAGLTVDFDDLRICGDLESGSFSVEYSKGQRLVAVDSVNDTRSHLNARKRLSMCLEEHR